MGGELFIFREVGSTTQQAHDVRSRSMRRHDVASTLILRHYDVMCPLGSDYVRGVWEKAHMFIMGILGSMSKISLSR